MNRVNNLAGTDMEEGSRASKVAAQIRNKLIEGEFRPGEKLSEQQVAQAFSISRNTLREVFRLLTSQGLLVHVPNRGVFVASPDEAAIIDLYRVRSIIQRGAIEAATKTHPALAKMRLLVDEAKCAAAAGDWPRVGTINMAFHRTMVELCDSQRLNDWFELVLAELRLVFGHLGDGAHLHEPYIAMNEALVTTLEKGDIAGALDQLGTYLTKSERGIHAALHRTRHRT
ncbi:GntR family transcriptional regulator [Paracoccus ravus]|uniref:GntR family transcriptional regulator n=1 Tax=Paracoccus ravus TaxID=2447760 RepID=UPI001FD72169|nr:GntR family transcriptional regulator [Paracoccus ravus]